MSLRRTGFTRNGFGMPQGSLKRRSKSKPKAIEPEVMVDVYLRDRGECVVSHETIRYPGPESFHHILPKAGWPEFRNEPRNIVLVAIGVHDEHERAMRRIRFSELPVECRGWLDGLADSVVQGFVQRTYPA